MKTLQIGSGGAVHAKYYDHTGRLDTADDPDTVPQVKITESRPVMR